MTRPLSTAGITGVVLVGLVLLLGHQQAKLGIHIMQSAVVHALDAHAPQIATLLASMHTNPPAEIADAVYQELQRNPSTSLISSMMSPADITVIPTDEGALECIIDASRSFGITPRAIEQITTNDPPGTIPHSEEMVPFFLESDPAALDISETIHIYAKLTGAYLDVDDAVRHASQPVVLSSVPAITKKQASRYLEKALRNAGVEMIHQSTNHIIVRLAQLR